MEMAQATPNSPAAMRIMQMVSSPTTSGPSVYVLELSQTLRQLGHEVTVVARPDSWVAQEAARLGFDTILSQQHRFPPDQVWKLTREIRARRIEILHTHMSRAHFMGVLLRGLCQIPCIATAHCRKLQAHWFWNNHVIATSRDTERFHRRYHLIPAQRISTIYSPAPQRLGATVVPPVSHESAITALRAHWKCPPRSSGVTVLGVVGEISPAKGQAYLLKAVKHLVTQGRKIHLVVIGNHRENHVAELKAWAIENGIHQSIHWAGFCDQIPLAMAALDIYVCPSLSESLPLTIVEAMSMAKPIVATQVGGIPEIIQHQGTGLLVPAKDASALAQAIEQLLDQPEFARQLGLCAQNKIQQDFDPLQQTLKVVDVYKRYLATTAGHINRRTPRQSKPLRAS